MDRSQMGKRDQKSLIDHNSERRPKMKNTYLDYLDILKTEGKDTDDPTYLMQAFSLTRKQALDTIKLWKETQ